METVILKYICKLQEFLFLNTTHKSWEFAIDKILFTNSHTSERTDISIISASIGLLHLKDLQFLQSKSNMSFVV
ncbi:hypothetical protein PmNV_095 [Penaeus monodon nudivirus]|uniref:Uncharacterized protein n=1 Tax=Penaeus monodon nudivirus TaxID=1529056 RepID=A0A076FD62_9VIRU|nr:hypothetical protein PmNV_095 [Penaeus monodon nudivirus]AII15883.1 hypothetical protein PmNV_095 [Penaeus monodon nudivirus]